MDKTKTFSILKAVLIPGIVFQSLITGGGFATGREIVQYCVQHNVSFFLVLTVVFFSFLILFFLMSETSRIFQAFDYRSWGQNIIPKYWIALDILFIIMAILVCAIVISGAVEVVKNVVSMPAIVGLVLALVIVVIVTAGGKKLVLTTKIFGALFLTAGYFLFALFSYLKADQNFFSLVNVSGNSEGWLISSFEYVGYNTVALPACLYTFSYIKNAKQSFWASVITGVLLVVPMFFVAYSIINYSPASLLSPVPLHYVVVHLGNPFLLILYYCILVWTLLDTAIGMVYAISSRIETHILQKKKINFSIWHRALFSGLFVICATLLSKVGIIDLVAKGYSIMSYCFIGLLVLPLMTIGIKKIIKSNVDEKT